MIKIGCRGVFHVGYLNLAVAVAKIVVQVYRVKPYVLGNETGYRRSRSSVCRSGKAIGDKNYTLNFTLAEQRGGKIKGGGNIGTAVIYDRLLNAF